MNHDNPIRELNVSYDIGKGMKSMKRKIERTFCIFKSEALSVQDTSQLPLSCISNIQKHKT